MFAVVLTATAMSITRLMLPALNKYTDDIERWVSKGAGRPVEIGSISGKWRGFTPELVLEDVRVLGKDGKQVLIRSRRARIGIDLVASLKNMRVEPVGFTIVGIRLDILRKRDGSFSLRNLDLGGDEKAGQGADEFVTWLLSQPNLGLEDSEVRWHDELNTGSDLTIKIVNLYLRNDDERHQLNGTLGLPQSLGNEFHFSVDVTGNVADPEDWEGEFYVDGNDVRLAQWMDEATRRQLAVRAGEVDFNFWGTWEASRLQKLEGRMGGSQLTLQADKQSLQLVTDFNVGRFSWLRMPEGWRFEADQLSIMHGGDASPQSRVLVQLSDNKSDTPRVDVSADRLRLQDINVVALAAVNLTPGLRESLSNLLPQGEVTNLKIQYQQREKALRDVKLHANVTGLGVEPWKDIPGLKDIHGTIRHEGDRGTLEIDINQQQSSIYFKSLFREAWPLGMVMGTVNWQHTGDAWQIETSQMTINNADINVQGRVRLDIFDDGRSPFLDVVAGFNDGNGERVFPYLPASIMSEETVAWLDRAIISGQVVSGGVVFRGSVADFPFDKGNGKFEVRFNVEKILLDYAKGWPAIDQVEAEVVFHGRSLEINAVAGKIFNADIIKAQVKIADLEADEPILTLEGNMHGTIVDGLDFLNKSPLKSRFQNYLSKVNASGSTQLELSMRIPLSDRANTLKGSYELIDNTLRLGELPDITAINGMLHFTRDDMSANNIQGKFMGEDIRADVSTRAPTAKAKNKTGATSGTAVAISSRIKIESLEKYFDMQLQDYVRGQTEWRASLQFPDGWGGGQGQARMFVESSLKGVEVLLPAPLGKSANKVLALDVVTELSEAKQKQVTFLYGGRLSVALGYRDQGGKQVLDSAAIHVGNDGVKLPASSTIKVTGDLSGIVFREWGDVIARFSTGDKLLKDKKLVVAAEHLHIPRDDNDKKTDPPGKDDTLDPRNIPSMKLSSKRVTYGKAELGTFKAEVNSIPGGVLAENIELKSSAMTVTGQGTWLKEGTHSTSRFSLNLEHKDFGQMLKDMDYVSGVKGGHTKMELAAVWPGSPLDVSLEKISGNLSMHVGKGRFVDIDPGVGRIFGLFSLQAIPRRLTLDFSDLFGKGFSYDRIDGTFTLEGGEAYTNNLIMEGPSAKIEATGRVGLQSEDYDQLVMVTPSLTGSLAVVGAVAGGPLGAVAALLAERIFKKQIHKISSYEYTVTGSWADPVISRVDTRTAPVENRK